MHTYLNTLFWFDVGKYGVIAVLAGASWLSRQRWLPHSHNGYASINGYVHKCTRCGRLPDGATHAGYNGMPGRDSGQHSRTDPHWPGY